MGDLFKAGRVDTAEPTMKGFFLRKPQSDRGIALPPELADAFSSFDLEDKILPTHEGTDKAFQMMKNTSVIRG